jgi:hypothetical protein
MFGGAGRRKRQRQPERKQERPPPARLNRLLFNSMNVAAVFASEKIYGLPGSVAFNCVPKFQFAPATWTRPLSNFRRVHAVLQYEELRTRNYK